MLYRDAGISCVAFHPTRHVAVTSSYGGDFKVILVEWHFKIEYPFPCRTHNINLIFQIWACNDEIQQKGRMIQNSGWACLAVGSYKYDPTFFFLVPYFSSIGLTILFYKLESKIVEFTHWR